MTPSFEHLSERESRAREAAQKLLWWCDEYPEYAHMVQRKAEVIIEGARSTPRSDTDAVLAALETGCTTVREIVEELEDLITSMRVHHALKSLLEVYLIREHKPEGSRQKQYYLTHNSPVELPAELKQQRKPYKPRKSRVSKVA